MSSQLALIICIIFVVWLLRLDRKQSPDVSSVSWIPTLWMLLIQTKPLGVWFSMSGQDMESGSLLDRAFLTVVFCLGFVVLLRRKFRWSKVVQLNPWLVALMVYMLTSIMWSEMEYTSFKRWTREMIAFVMSCLIASEKYPPRAIQSVLRRVTYIVIPFSYVLIHYFSRYGREYNRWSGELMWCGVATQKNALGLVCANAVFFLIWAFVQRKKGDDPRGSKYLSHSEVIVFALSLYLMGGPEHSLSYSATSNITVIAGLSIFVVFSWLKNREVMVGSKALVAVMVLIIAYGTVTPFMGKLTLVDISSIVGRDESLTGRSEIWARLVPFAIEKPIWGHGFGGFWTDEMRAATDSHAHNGYLDIILNLGFVGLGLFCAFIVSCCRKAQNAMAEDFDWGVFFVSYLIMALVHNIGESSFAEFSGKLSGIVLMLAVSLRAICSNKD